MAGSSNFADDAFAEFERSLKTLPLEGKKMIIKNLLENCFNSNFAELRAAFNGIEDCNNCHGEGKGKCATVSGLIAEAVQKSREKLSSMEEKVKVIATQTQVVMNNFADLGNSAPHVATFYKSPAGPVEVEPAPEFRSAEGFSPGGLATVTNPAQTMVKYSKKKLRPRDRKTKKPHVDVQVVKTEENGRMPDDGHSWRKYGCKTIKTAIYKKAYYKCNAPCTVNKNRTCIAKKTVQQANNDPTVLHVAYDSPHSCKLGSQTQVLKSPNELLLQGNEKNLHLAEQMLSHVNSGRIPVTSTTNWAERRLDQFNLTRTSSEDFSVISQEELDERTNYDVLPDFKEVSGLVNGGGELSDLLESSEFSWRPADLVDVELDPDQFLVNRIVQGGHGMAHPDLELQHDSLFRHSFMSHIQIWHPHGN